jgi:hypothetical protein
VTSAVGAADTEMLGQRGIKATNAVGRVTTVSLETLVLMMEKGEIGGPELRSFSFSDAAEALATVGSGHVRGKIVVIPA